MEKLLVKMPEGLADEEQAAWATTVIRNEALQIHRRHKHEIDVEFEEIAENWVSGASVPEDLLIDSEWLAHGREALQRLSPDQTRCLLLRADGLGYPEICEATGFSYAKVNRLLSDGRKAFHLHVGMIDSGRECERLAPMLSTFADGEPVDREPELRMHLSSCLHCQATLRDYRGTADKLGALFPLGALFVEDQQSRGLLERIGQAMRGPVDWLQARLAGSGGGAQQGLELTMAKKAALVVGMGASILAGGVVVERSIDADRGTAGRSEPNPRGPGVISAVQLDRTEHKRERARLRQDRRAQARERERERAAAAVEAAAVSSRAGDAAPLAGGQNDPGTATDPADTDPEGPVTDGQAEGFAP